MYTGTRSTQVFEAADVASPHIRPRNIMTAAQYSLGDPGQLE